jgi:hypothetical protein
MQDNSFKELVISFATAAATFAVSLIAIGVFGLVAKILYIAFSAGWNLL